ncbi:hypothetical protein PVK06_035511 [Gossypium arboreum]|uniref:Uncharacterized protein n=1 Tax=Gossypium arboreum TaxID=29729 RepID=A0ABR0NH05_GOSAR|nr:hypothetical protein PVK06_035511 [Gossypium arboreum]
MSGQISAIIYFNGKGIASTSSGWQSTCDFRGFNKSTRRVDVLPTTSTGEGTPDMENVGGSKNEDGNESNVDSVREPSANGSEVALFSEPELVTIEPEDGEGGEDEEKDPRFIP